jgi:hypothetical protein
LQEYSHNRVALTIPVESGIGGTGALRESHNSRAGRSGHTMQSAMFAVFGVAWANSQMTITQVVTIPIGCL